MVLGAYDVDDWPRVSRTRASSLVLRRIRTIYNQLGPVELQSIHLSPLARAAALLRQDQDAARRHGIHSRSDSEDECELGALKSRITPPLLDALPPRPRQPRHLARDRRRGRVDGPPAVASPRALRGRVPGRELSPVARVRQAT